MRRNYCLRVVVGDTRRIPWDLRGGAPFWDLHQLILLLIAIAFRPSPSRPAEIAR